MPIKPSTSQACNTQTCTECKYTADSRVLSAYYEHGHATAGHPFNKIYYNWNGSLITIRSCFNCHSTHYNYNNCYRSGGWCYYTGQYKGLDPLNSANRLYEICRRP